MNGQQFFTSAKQNTKYAYAVGRIRALETRLLDGMAIGRLLEADDAQEVLKALSEGEYEAALSNISDAADFETALNIEQERIYSLVDQLSLDPELTGIFRARWDFHNLKALLKSSYLKAADSAETSQQAGATDDVLVTSGLIPVDAIRFTIEPDDEQSGSGLSLTGSNGSSYIMDALEDTREQYEESQNPQMIDIVIDKHIQSFLYQRAADYPSPFLCGYFEAIADLTNIKSFVRVKMLNEGVRLLDAVLLPYGSLDRQIYMGQFDETVENVAASLTGTRYADVVAEGIRSWTEEHSLAVFEKLADNYLINYIKPAKYMVFGVEPLIGYLLAKEHEMKLIRIIVTGKLNDLPAENIRERLRDTYV